MRQVRLKYTANESDDVGDADLVLSSDFGSQIWGPVVVPSLRTGSASPTLNFEKLSCRAIEGRHGARTAEGIHYKLQSVV